MACAGHFGTTDRFGINLQTCHGLEIEKDHLGPAREQIHPLQGASTTPKLRS